MSHLKAGGGYSRLAAPAGVVPTLAAHGCEIVFLPQAETEIGSIAASNLDSLLALADQMDFVVIGPGISLYPETQQLVRELVARIEKPVLIDGDGISAIQHELDCVRRRTMSTVLTPHMGEMARISNVSIADIQNDRVAILREVSQNLSATIVMKGAHTLIGQADGRIFINMTGNSGMGTAGSGDVLTGTISALSGLGLPFDAAVRTGVFVHGLAGDQAAAEIGRDGMTATDILRYLPAAMRLLRDGIVSPSLQKYYGPKVI